MLTDARLISATDPRAPSSETTVLESTVERRPAKGARTVAPVLIVEDDPQIAGAIRGALEDEGFEAVVASSVEEATTSFATKTPALILLDWNLPDGSGEDVVRAVRPRNASVPIVVMSAARDAIVESYAIEARDRLAKPFDLDRLVSLVRRYCG